MRLYRYSTKVRDGWNAIRHAVIAEQKELAERERKLLHGKVRSDYVFGRARTREAMFMLGEARVTVFRAAGGYRYGDPTNSQSRSPRAVYRLRIKRRTK